VLVSVIAPFNYDQERTATSALVQQCNQCQAPVASYGNRGTS
jgi:hypothetical protein